MRNGSIDVTVIVPCYNTQRYVDQALTSAEQNMSSNLEILAINDGSTDGSLDILKRHAARDVRVRVIDKPNQGYGATVNRGIDEARGTYVTVLEPDDWVLPRTYDDLFALACAHGRPNVVKSAYWRVMSNEKSDGMRAYGYLRGRVGKVGEPFVLGDEPQLIQYHPSIWSALYEREYLAREGVRMIEAPGAGWVDNPFCVASLATAKSIVYTDDAYYCYREDLATASSAAVSSRLMIDRWNDRQDVLDARGIGDEGIRRANVIVGLRFFANILKSGALEDPTLLDDARRMAKRMDDALVCTIDCISPDVVARVLKLAGSNAPALPKARYAAHLAREASWALRNNGMRFFVHNLTLAKNS